MGSIKILTTFTFCFLVGCSTSVDKESNAKSTHSSAKEMLSYLETTEVEIPKEQNYVDTLSKALIENRIVNGYELVFIEISKEKYKTLISKIRNSELPISDPGLIVTKLDSCNVILLSEVPSDTFCNFNDGEYYERFVIKGLWKEAGQLLVEFENWEDQYDYLINIRTGNHYIFGPVYQLSPNGKRVLTYSNVVDYPLYTNEFIVSEFFQNDFNEYFNLDFGRVAISRADWIANDEVLLEAGLIDSDLWEFTNKTYYLMKFKKAQP